MINLFQPTLGAEELAAIEQVFASGWLGRGPRTTEFEEAFASHLGVDAPHVRTIDTCTEGLFLSMELLGIGPGDEVVLPTIHFVGAGNAIAACGARPVFCDVDRRTLNARPEDVEACLTPRTRAVMVLHYGGLPAQIDEICRLCRERGVAVVEDSACSISSSVGGRRCGTFGDVATWSFDAMKVLVTGDGGMVYVRDPELAARVEGLTYLGLESASGFSRAASADRWWEFEVSSFSRRSIVNDVVSSMGLIQLEKVPGFVERRRQVHEAYDRELGGLDWLRVPPPVPDGSESTYYFYWLQMAPETRDALARFLRERGVYTTFRYYPLHWVAAYDSDARLPGAEAAARETLCIPIHQALSDDDVATVVEGIRSFAAAPGAA